jgi:hypothetical protein
MRFAILFVILLISTEFVFSQGNAPGRLKVFVDCSTTSCDLNYIRSEINIVDFLLDRVVADVHVLLTEQSTGGGGSTIKIILYGQGSLTSLNDTIDVIIPPNTTAFERREQLVKGLKVGLLPLLLKTPFAKFIDVNMKWNEGDSSENLVATDDPWNYWTFQIGSNGSYNSGQVYKSIDASGYVTANRVTRKLKVSFAGSSNYSNYKYTYDDNGTNYKYEVLNTDYMVQHSLIKTLRQHWGLGYQLAFSQNTFANNKRRVYGKLAAEYSVFPYKDVNTRFITLTYGVDVRSNKYFDTTIYFLKDETLVGQMAQANFALIQKWGTFNSTIAYSSYFKDLQLNNLSANLNFNFRVSGGLFFGMYVSASRVRDQVYLVKGKADVQDVLTRRRQLASEYNINTGIGLNYRFGSKLNNFVNETLRNL